MHDSVRSIAGSTGLLFGYPPTRTASRDPRDWEAGLRVLAGRGFDAVDFSQLWTPVTELTDAAVDELAEVVRRVGMTTAGISLVGIDLLHPAGVDDASVRVSRAIDQADRLGGPIVSLGLHPVQTAVLPPSDAPGYPELDGEIVDRMSVPLRELARAAEAKGVELSLEMHESSVLYRASNLLQILDAVGSPAVGANPDLGNLLRAPGLIAEEPATSIALLAGRINYWHVKNGVRFEVGPSSYRSFPTEMSQGSIDYRTLLRTALDAGFRGPLVVEHYGGDVLRHAGAGATYLRELLDDLAAEELGAGAAAGSGEPGTGAV